MTFDRPLQIQLSGAAVALISGVLLGGFMQPHLGETRDGPAGPQTLAAGGGARGEAIDSGVSLASYRGTMPDYVMGTDFKRSVTWPGELAAVSAPREAVSDDTTATEAPPAVLTIASYEERAPLRHRYPSLGAARSADDEGVDDDSLPSDPGAAR